MLLNSTEHDLLLFRATTVIELRCPTRVSNLFLILWWFGFSPHWSVATAQTAIERPQNKNNIRTRTAKPLPTIVYFGYYRQRPCCRPFNDPLFLCGITSSAPPSLHSACSFLVIICCVGALSGLAKNQEEQRKHHANINLSLHTHIGEVLKSLGIGRKRRWAL